MRRFIICLVLALSLTFAPHCLAAMSDAYSWSYWSNKSGITSGSVQDIMYEYFGSLGYAGNLTDRFHAWLVTQTGAASSLSINDLMYLYFVAVSSYGVKNGDGDVVRNGDGVEVTYQ